MLITAVYIIPCEEPKTTCLSAYVADSCIIIETGVTESSVQLVFGKTAVNNFCSSLKIDMICRAHQCVTDGYEFFADRKCLTLFSAPCYCGELDNQAAVLQVGSRLECRVLTFKKEVKPAATPRGVSCEDGYAALRTSQSQNPTTDEGTKVTQSPAETPILRTAEDTDSQEKGKGQKQSKEQRNEKK
ncbi:hypothetical protein Y032_0182g876 [Ancylostoma ceylanicum]|uniref:protein-serine/threonine phosphatase n=1 Tax=Ancylostoma ceylanicum TaxID=53326 RepID=A0A016SRS0_9BILA|nr:hypothetical protein Y032_0182g876 [Ancylostoma ceylanicum]